jgi:hypothetical protein
MKIAFVASVYNEVDKIKKQLKKKKVKNIDVFEYNTEPNGYDEIIYNVRPNKEYSEILDLSQCLQFHGFPEELYNPPVKTGDRAKDKNAKEEQVANLRLPYLKTILDGDKPIEVNKKIYIEKINHILARDKKLTELNTKDLITRFEITSNPVELIAICAIILDRVVCEPMLDDYGREVRGYVATNGKVVSNFLNPDSITWISELWSEKLDKEDIYYKNKYIKALKTKIKRLIKEKQSIWGLRFFIDFLLESDKFEKEILSSGSGSGYGEPRSDDIIIDEDEIPF